MSAEAESRYGLKPTRQAREGGDAGWWEWAAGGAVVAAFAALVLWGLGWGLPSRERARLEGASSQSLKLPPELVGQSWRVWGSRGRRSELADLYPRHLFNPVRSYHPDEYQVFKSLSNMRPRQLDFDPKNYIYPSLHTYLTGAAVGACSLIGVVKLRPDITYYLDHPDELGRLYLVGRALSLLASVGTLLVVWRVGEGMGRWTGLLAAGMLAAMPAFGLHSHNLTRDTLTALAAVTFFACCRRVARDGAAKSYDLAGVAAGLCMGLQYFAVVLWVLVPVAGVLWARKGHGAKRGLVTGLFASLILMVAFFALTSPYHLLRADRFLADFRSETTHVGGGVVGRLASLGWARHFPGMLPALATWPLTVVFALGVGWAAARRTDDDWLLLAWVAVWAVVVGYDGRAYSRYYVPLLPAVAWLGARGLMASWEAAGRLLRVAWARAALGGVALCAAIGPAATVTIAWAELFARENVRTIAGAWIAQNVPQGTRIGMTQWPWQYEMPPLDPSRYRLVVMEDSPRRSPYDLERLWHTQPELFVTSSLQCATIESWRRPADARGRFWQALLGEAGAYRVVKRFAAPHRILGTDLSALPEDMRYVNPVIYILERRRTQAALSAPRAGT